jgi:hypothetical protein
MLPSRVQVLESHLEHSGKTLFCCSIDRGRSQYKAVGIATGYGLDHRGVGVRVPDRLKNFSLLHVVQTGSVTHPVSYPMGTGGKAAGA